jgi:RsmE family RNA methyltransferase
MNRILFPEKEAARVLEVGDPRLEHVRGVLRLKPGDHFDVGLVNGPTGKARIVSISASRLELEVTWGDVPALPPPVTLLIGMPRPATARKLLKETPTLGLRRLLFSATGRSDPAYARSRLWTSEEWRKLLQEGVEQAFDTHLPEVVRAASLEEGLAALPEAGTRLALDVYEGTCPLSEALPSTGSVVMALGPERGWNRDDRALLRGAGFTLVSMGKRVMRVETAAIAALTLAHARRGLL